MLRTLDQVSRPREVQAALNRFVLEGANFNPEEQAELSKKSFVLAMQRLLASARALVSDDSSVSIANPLHNAKGDQARDNKERFCLGACTAWVPWSG